MERTWTRLCGWNPDARPPSPGCGSKWKVVRVQAGTRPAGENLDGPANARLAQFSSDNPNQPLEQTALWPGPKSLAEAEASACGYQLSLGQFIESARLRQVEILVCFFAARTELGQKTLNPDILTLTLGALPRGRGGGCPAETRKWKRAWPPMPSCAGAETGTSSRRSEPPPPAWRPDLDPEHTSTARLLCGFDVRQRRFQNALMYR